MLVERNAVFIIMFFLVVLLATSDSAADFQWCAYKFYMHPETWDKAKAVCAANGMTLARITDTAQHSYLTSYVNDQLIKQNPTIQTDAWIGLRKDAVGNVKYENCNLYAAADYNPTQNLAKDCVYFDAGQPTFLGEDCTSSKAFLCQEHALDLNDCFTYKMVSLITPGWNFYGGDVEYIRPGPDDCSTLCTDDCVAYAHSNGKCVPMTRHSCPCSFNGYYTVKGVLNTESQGVSADVINNFCGGPAVSSPEILISSPEILSSSPEILVSSSEVPISSSEGPISSSVIPVSSSEILYPALTTVVSSSAVSSSIPYLSVQSAVTTPGINTSPGVFSFFSTGVLTPTSTAGTSSSHCFCSCGDNKNETMSVEELQEKIKELKSVLSVDKKDLSSWKRKLTSAPDKRTSATGIGFLGVAILLVVGCLVVVLDVPTVLIEIKRLKGSFTKSKDQ